MIFLKIFTKYSTYHSLSANTCFKSLAFILFIPPVYEVYRGYIVFAFSVCVCVCVFVCKLFFPSKISQELLDLGS